MANRAVLTGRLTADPELRHTKDNTPVASFSIAIPRKFKKDVTDFLDIVAWRKEAEFVGKYFTKGKWIEVDGSIQSRSYTDKQGNKRTAVEIVADSLSFVGDKPKEEGVVAQGERQAPPPPAAPPGFDPFQCTAPPPIAPGDFPGAQQAYNGYAAPSYSPDFGEFDDDGDLPF